MAQRKRKDRRRIEDRDGEKFHRMLTRLKTSECILCGGPPNFVGFWTPSPEFQRRLLAAPGKVRSIGYGLCRRCRAEPDCPVRVEDHILAAFAPANLPVDVN